MKRFYLIITCQILALILFLSAHFLYTIYILKEERNYLFGIEIGFLIVDICLYIAITIQILSILLFISLEVSYGK